MTAVHRLKVPAFDLNWLEYVQKEQPHVFLLVAGGGGSTKSGVKNQIMIARSEYPGGKELEFLDSYMTDSDGLTALCNGVSHGAVQGKEILVALVDAYCVILEVSMKTDKANLIFEKRLQFQADFHEEAASLNASLVTAFGVVVTAGEDRTIRTWLIDSSSSASKWTSTKIFDLQDHSAPVSALAEHPSEPWICSAGKDGSCKIWNLKVGSLMIDIPYLVDGIPNFDPKKMKMESRGCCFSLDGKYLFSIQSPRKGSTYLIKWELEKRIEKSIGKEMKEEEEGKTVLIAFARKKKEMHKVPSTRLAVSEDREYIAVGASDGSIVVVQSEHLQEVKRSNCHDLPVTGLGFAPLHLTKEKELDFMIATCSADNKLNLIKVKAYSAISRFLLILAILIVFLFLSVLTWGLHTELSKVLNDQ